MAAFLGRQRTTWPLELIVATIVATVFVIANIANATLVADDVYSVQSFPAMRDHSGFASTAQMLLFNADLRSEYRLFGLSRLLHFLLVLLFGATAWPYAAIIALSQVATAAGIYWLLRSFGANRPQAGALALIWLLSPFASTSAFWHYSYFILPYQLAVACAVTLYCIQQIGARRFSGWHAAVVLLCLMITWTGEAHLVAAVLFLNLVIFAARGTRPLRFRLQDAILVALTIAGAVAFHRWRWAVLSGGFHGQLRYDFAPPSLDQIYLRTEVFARSLINGAAAQIIPIAAFAKSLNLVGVLAAACAVGAMWWTLWRRREERTTTRPWSGVALTCALLVIVLASLAVVWMLFAFAGWATPALWRRYGYIQYTIGAMTVAALLMSYPTRRWFAAAPGMVVCCAAAWLWFTLNIVCLPTVRAQDNGLWSKVSAALATKRDGSVLFVTDWERAEMPGFELTGGTPGLRGALAPEIFETPLAAFWWESEYVTAVVHARGSGYNAIARPDGRVDLHGTGLLRPTPLVVPGDSLVVVVNTSVVPPRWDTDLRDVKVFPTWNEYREASTRQLLGPWQTPNGTVSLTTDGSGYALDDGKSKAAVELQPSKLVIPSPNGGSMNEGQVNIERTRIDWRDGTAWTRMIPELAGNAKFRAVSTLLGQWFIRDQLCTIRFSGQDDNELILINERGSRVEASRRDNVIYAPAWSTHGTLSADERTLTWSNGTVWHR